MNVLGIDLGGTKLACAIFSENGDLLVKETVAIGKRKGPEVGSLITGTIVDLIDRSLSQGTDIRSIGISVPGIFSSKTGRVWAPNIEEWTDYPLLSEVSSVSGGIPVAVDSDRACYILGEVWKGNARGCRDAVFLSVGTGIGAGIMVNGEILRGSNDIAGSTGWMALNRPFREEYAACGCFEYHASGSGIAMVAREILSGHKEYDSILGKAAGDEITSREVFEAYDKGDKVAVMVIKEAVEYWGMAVANFVSLFDPEKIIFGGGVFGPAVSLLPDIAEAAARWAQPVSFARVSIDVSGLGGDAGVYGAGRLALRNAENQ
ncbi:MAG TPA: ROK family protein [Bacteroidales bacterium]|nr:ROK family protein [Bacteroidales bacterium]HNR40656.1 ROK family protein [Bacteroidales bacterium]HPM17714.1 ROK family protein [Bacteroidales bacterium]